MPHDIFISYESTDKNAAYAACNALESARIRCWIAPRDCLPGKAFAASIVEAIRDCRVLVLMFSARANQSEFVKREVECALSETKIIVPFRIEDIRPSGEMRFYVENLHWLDALTPPLELHLTSLVETVSRLLGAEGTVIESAAAGAGPIAERRDGFEYRSDLCVFGIPVVHVAIGLPVRDGRRRKARGLIAIGDNAIGLIAIGAFPRGVVALGTFPLGVIPIGLVAFGLFPVGAVAIGLVAAYGLIAVAPIAMGCLAGGYYCAGDIVAGRFLYTHSNPDPQAVRFFQPWLKPWLHVVLITLCVLSYLAPKIIKAMKWALGREKSNG